MSRFPVRALTQEQIALAATPASANQPEAVASVLFDTLTVTSANSALPLTFFQQNTLADPTISNVLGGRLPQGYNFQVYAFGFDILRVPIVAAALTTVAAITDVATILKTNRGVFQFQKSSKQYGVVPLTFLHASGGETGGLSEGGAVATGSAASFANNGLFSGGFDIDGSIIIRENENFSAQVQFGASGTTNISADVFVRCWMRGTMFRPVR